MGFSGDSTAINRDLTSKHGDMNGTLWVILELAMEAMAHYSLMI